MSRQRRQEPQRSASGASGASASVVRISPRNSHEPNRRETRLVCLPCQPMPARWASGFFHHRRGVDEQPDLAVELFVHPARHGAELLPHHVVIVAPLGVDRDRAPVAPLERRQRIGGRAVVLAHHDRGFRLRPEPRDVAPPILVDGEPAHVAVMPGADEAREVALRLPAQRRLAEPHRVEPLGERAPADPFAESVRGHGCEPSSSNRPAKPASVPASIAPRSRAISR